MKGTTPLCALIILHTTEAERPLKQTFRSKSHVCSCAFAICHTDNVLYPPVQPNRVCICCTHKHTHTYTLSRTCELLITYQWGDRLVS